MKSRRVAAWVFLAGCYYLVLAYAADLSVHASAVLSVVLASLSTGVLNAAPKVRIRFRPYRVDVTPKWEQMLTDLHIARTPEEWESLWKAVEQIPRDGYNVWRNGVSFTILQQSEDGERLIYRHDYRIFASEVEFDYDLTPRNADGTPIRRWPSTEVHFFIRFGYNDSLLPIPYEGIAGHDLGIEVSADWWAVVRAGCPKPLDEQSDYMTGRVRIILARISYREFDLYWDAVPWSGEHVNKTAVRLRAVRDEHRKKLGWTANEAADIPGSYEEWIEHKYFSVNHRPV